jgi:hypothetical protein
MIDDNTEKALRASADRIRSGMYTYDYTQITCDVPNTCDIATRWVERIDNLVELTMTTVRGGVVDASA